MKIKMYTLWFAVLYIWPVDGEAQITIDVEDTRQPIGPVFEFETLTLEGDIADVGVDVGTAGADQFFDLTSQYGTSGIVSRVAAIPLEEAPGAEQFPQADYVLHSWVQAQEGVAEVEIYVFMEHTLSGDVAVGIEGQPGIELLLPTTQEQVPWPLTFGKQWEMPQDVFQPLGQGVALTGTLAFSNRVDAWGTVETPAGRYECLRLHRSAIGVYSYEGSPELEELGGIDAQIESYEWITEGFGTIAVVQQTRMEIEGQPPIELTQIIRLMDVSGVVSAVEMLSWGQVKWEFR